nr:hypothetical protein HmN_000887700 [Hymenolepis microstoma]
MQIKPADALLQEEKRLCEARSVQSTNSSKDGLMSPEDDILGCKVFTLHVIHMTQNNRTQDTGSPYCSLRRRNDDPRDVLSHTVDNLTLHK